MHKASLESSTGRRLVALALVACALVALVALAPVASAFPTSGGVQYTGTCDNVGCHSGGGNAPRVSLVSSDGASATYDVAANGIEWAVFNGSTHVAGGLNGGGNTFTMPVGLTYTVIDVLGDPGTASSGKTTVVGGKATYAITPSAGANGAIAPAKTVGVVSGSDRTFTVTANAGYHVDTVTADGAPVALTAGTYTFTNVTADHTIAATFAASPVTSYTITPSAGAGGSISPASAQTVASGASVTFTITPSAGYQIDALTVDGAAVAATPSYTFSSVAANHTIAVSFKLAAPTRCSATITLAGLKAGVLKRGKTVTVKGAVKPAHAGNVTLTIERKAGAKWVKAKSVSRAVNATSGAYSYGYKPTKTGSYRVKASVAKTAAFTAAVTAYKAFKVK